MSGRAMVGALLLAAGLLGSAACTGEADGGDPAAAGGVTRLATVEARPADDAPAPIDEALMIALAQARNHHHKADVLLDEARADEAIAALRAILAIRFPAGAPEGEDVLLDARARLAKVLTSRATASDPAPLDQALAVVDEGIARASRPSFFLANLYTARGEVLEALAASRAAADGRDPRARDARRDAIEAFDRSIAINQELLRGLAAEGAR